MTSIAVTASICASTSEAALLVASFMQFSFGLGSLDLGAIHRCPQRPDDPVGFTRNTPRRVFALTSPHSANIDVPRSNSNAAAFWLVCSRFMRVEGNFESEFPA